MPYENFFLNGGNQAVIVRLFEASQVFRQRRLTQIVDGITRRITGVR